MQKAIERIKLMRDIEVAARDAAEEKIAATNDPATIAGLVTEFLSHCMAVGAFVMALEAIEKEAAE